MKKILYIGDAASPHLARWIKLVHNQGFEVSVFSFRQPAPDIAQLRGVKYEVYEGVEMLSSSILFKKFSYLKALPALRRLAKRFQPDIIHAHYASSYGLLAALLDHHPLIVSAWGSDVYAFGDTRIGRMILRYNFSKADRILSTSEVMKRRVQEFSNKEIQVTPFGVDVDLFVPGKVDCPFFDNAELVFGMIKTMEYIYGVDLVLHAFKRVVQQFPEKRIKLLLVGGGDPDQRFRELAIQIGVSDLVRFTGRIEQSEVPHYHQMIDVFLNPSRAESFGVSVLEAMACGRPVIVAKTGGLEEIVTDQLNGLYCVMGSIESLADKMSVLTENFDLRSVLADNARNHVLHNYDKRQTDKLVLKVYDSILRN